MQTPETPDLQQPQTTASAFPGEASTPTGETVVTPQPAVPAAPVVPSEPVAPPATAAILETVELPAATDDAGAQTGGEWQELLDRLNGWLGDSQVGELWQQSQRPLKLLGVGLALLLVLRLVGSLLGTLDGVPMLPRLLQLVGLIWLGLYSSRHLVRSDSRQQLLTRVDGIWASVVGRAD